MQSTHCRLILSWWSKENINHDVISRTNIEKLNSVKSNEDRKSLDSCVRRAWEPYFFFFLSFFLSFSQFIKLIYDAWPSKSILCVSRISHVPIRYAAVIQYRGSDYKTICTDATKLCTAKRNVKRKLGSKHRERNEVSNKERRGDTRWEETKKIDIVVIFDWRSVKKTIDGV